MGESDEIVKYLFAEYAPGGDSKIPFMLRAGAFTDFTCYLAALSRMEGIKSELSAEAARPEQPLELYAYEASPFVKVVREKLTALELPHIVHYAPRGSPQRDMLMQKMARFQVPFLEDPNTDTKMFESAAIVDYLEQVYA